MSIRVDSKTKEMPEIITFVTSAKQYCTLIEGVGAEPLHNFLKTASFLAALLYSQANQLPDIFVSESTPTPPSFPCPTERLLSGYIGKYDYYNVSLQPCDIEKPELAVGSLSSDLAELYSDLQGNMGFFLSDDVPRIGHALWEWKFLFENHWGEHLTNALRHIHYLLYSERIEFA